MKAGKRAFLIYEHQPDLDMPHHFIVVGYDPEKLFDWCEGEFGPAYRPQASWYRMGVEFVFSNEHDAFHFKMMFG